MTQTSPPSAPTRPIPERARPLLADRPVEVPLAGGTQDPSPRPRLLDLSLTQLVGGSLAAATAAALGSRLGLLGTIAGAAIGSVVTAVAANLYTNSMARAREAVVLARAYGRGTLGRVYGRGPLARRSSLWLRLPDRTGTRRLLTTAGALFAVAAVVLTGVQLTTGAQVTGTTIGRGGAAHLVEGPSRGGSAASSGSGIPSTGTTHPSTTPTTPATTAPTPTGGPTGTPMPGSTSGAPGPTTAPDGSTGGPSGTPPTTDAPAATTPPSTGTGTQPAPNGQAPANAAALTG
jgi:hypothetical protein